MLLMVMGERGGMATLLRDPETCRYLCQLVG